MKTKRHAVPFLLSLAIVALAGLSACSDNDDPPVRENGRHVRVRAPFTRVDVWVPEDDAEDTEVHVDVDDD